MKSAEILIKVDPKMLLHSSGEGVFFLFKVKVFDATQLARTLVKVWPECSDNESSVLPRSEIFYECSQSQTLSFWTVLAIAFGVWFGTIFQIFQFVVFTTFKANLTQRQSLERSRTKTQHWQLKPEVGTKDIQRTPGCSQCQKGLDLMQRDKVGSKRENFKLRKQTMCPTLVFNSEYNSSNDELKYWKVSKNSSFPKADIKKERKWVRLFR